MPFPHEYTAEERYDIALKAGASAMKATEASAFIARYAKLELHEMSVVETFLQIVSRRTTQIVRDYALAGGK